MMNVHPQCYTRIIKTKYWMLVCTYSNSVVVLGSRDHFEHCISREMRARKGLQEQPAASAASGGKKSGLALLNLKNKSENIDQF